MPKFAYAEQERLPSKRQTRRQMAASNIKSSSPAAPAPLDDLPVAISLIAEVSGVSTAEVADRLRLEHNQLGANVRNELRRRNVPAFVFGDEMVRFYEETDAFLYETYTWNRYPTKQKMRQWMISFLQRRNAGSVRILAFGDGLGFDAAGLAMSGHQVTYFEVGQRNVAFAKRIFELNGTTVDIRDRLENLTAESYDAVICLDVLEHVPNPPELVQKLASFLRPGGHLIVHAPFWFLHPTVSTHLAANLKYSGELKRLYGDAGLRAVDGAIAWNPLALEKSGGPNVTPPTISPLLRAKVGCGRALLAMSRWWTWPLTAITLGIIGSERRLLLKDSPFPRES